MLVENATKEECAEMLIILEETYDKSYETEILNEFKMLREKAERLKQLHDAGKKRSVN